MSKTKKTKSCSIENSDCCITKKAKVSSQARRKRATEALAPQPAPLPVKRTLWQKFLALFA